VATGLVGRSAELTTLRELVARTNQSRPVVGLLSGDAGIGKSRVLTEAAAAIDMEQISLPGYEPEAQVPLANAAALLRRLDINPLAGWASPDAQRSSVPASTEPLQVFEATFTRLVAHGPLLIVADDMQWVDETSLALLHYLIRASENAHFPLVVLGASRPTFATHRFHESLRRVISDPGRLVLVPIPPLEREAGLTLARSLKPGLNDEAAAQLWQRAGGTPFWLEMLALGRGETTEVDAVVESGLRYAEAGATELIAALAFLGRPAALSDIVDAEAFPLNRATAVITRLMAAGLVVETAEGWRVSHDLVREGVIRQLPAELARAVHRRLAEKLAEHMDSDPRLAMQVLEHRRAGGLPVLDLASAIATGPSRRLLTLPELRAIDEIAEQSDPAIEQTIPLRRAVARLAGELGEHELALARWEALHDLDRDPDEGRWAALSAAESAMHLGRAARARELLSRVRGHGAGDPSTSVAADAVDASIEQWVEHHPERASAAARRAVVQARTLAERSGGVGALPTRMQQSYLRALQVATEAALFAGRPGEVLALADELVHAAAAGDERTRIRGMIDGGLALRWLGRNEEAEGRLRQAWIDARRQVLPQATLEVGAVLARILYSRGHLAEAAHVLVDCRDLGERLGELGRARAISVVVSELVDHSLGPWASAVNGLREAAQTEQDPHFRTHAFLERGLLLARLQPTRSAAEVRACVRDAVSDTAQAGCTRCRGEVALRGAEALARVGAVDEARNLLRLRPTPPDVADRAMALWARQANAAIEGAGAADAAVEAWQAVVADAEEQGLRLEALWARLDLACALQTVDRGAAIQTLRAAGLMAQDMGARTEADLADQLLRSLGVRTWRRTQQRAAPHVLAGLTNREREIVRQLAAGASNPEIAASLFLSRKTVERHVSNCLAKLGLRNRTELAAALGPQGDTYT
jgi:DNA-binding NarL/FixJ family response regulator